MPALAAYEFPVAFSLAGASQTRLNSSLAIGNCSIQRSGVDWQGHKVGLRTVVTGPQGDVMQSEQSEQSSDCILNGEDSLLRERHCSRIEYSIHHPGSLISTASYRNWKSGSELVWIHSRIFFRQHMPAMPKAKHRVQNTRCQVQRKCGFGRTWLHQFRSLKFMIEIRVTLHSHGARDAALFEGDVANVSRLRALSSYRADFDGRASVILTDYPRWSESARALVARCISIGTPAQDAAWSLDRWSAVQISLGIRNGGRGNLHPISMIQLHAGTDCDQVGWIEGNLTGFCQCVPSRSEYADIWQLVQFALTFSAFGSDTLPEPRPLDVRTHFL
jgi:hypothetical protein